MADYTVKVRAVLDTKGIQSQLQSLGKNAKFKVDTTGIQNAEKQIQQLGTSGQTASKKVTGATGRMNKDFKGLTGYVGQSAKNFTDITKKVAMFGLSTNIINGASQGVKNMVGSVVQLDGSLTELKKVSDLNGKSLKQYTDKAFEAGKTVAKTGTEMVDAATEFRKSGWTDKDALTLGTVAAKYTNISDTQVTTAEAAKFLISQIKAFNIEAKNSEHIIDATNEVANNFAVGTNDLSTALTKAASGLGTVGNSFEETMGLVTAGTEVMVNQPGKVGRGLRTIALNIAALSKESDTWTAANGKVNVSLKDQEGNMRSTYDIMTDLYKGVKGQSVAWDKLSNSERTAIAQQAAGKNQFEVFTSVMNNYKNAIKATNTALNSTGSAEKENQKAMDSIEGRLQRLRSAFEYFAYKTINGDFIKSIVSAGTSLLDFLGSDAGQATLKFAAVSTTVIALTRAFAKLGAVVKGLSLTDALSTLIFGSKSVASATESAAKATSKYAAAEAASTAVFTNGYKAKAKGAKAVSQTATVVGKTTKQTGVLSKAWSGLSRIVAAHPFISAAAGVAATTYAVTKFVDKYKETYTLYSKTKQKIKENASEIEKLENKTESLTKTEQDRLISLKTQEKALERQTKAEAKAALQKATKNYVDKDGETKSGSGRGRNSTGMRKIDNDAKNIEIAKREMEGYTRQLKDGAITTEEWQEAYGKSADKIQDVVKSYEDQIKAMNEAEEAGIELNKGEKELRDRMEEFVKESEKAEDAYTKITDQSNLMDLAKDWLPDADKLSQSEMGMAQMADRVNDINLAMSRTGKDGQKAFKKIMKGIEGGYEELGKFNKETGKYEFDNTSIDEYAKAMNVTTEAAEGLLKKQTESGKIEWKIPKQDLESFNESTQELESGLQKTDGTMIRSRQSLVDLAKSMGIPEAATKSFIKGFKDAGNSVINLDQSAPKLTKQLSEMGDSFGIVTNKAGKVKEVNLDSLASGIKEIGGSEGDLSKVVSQLSEVDGIKFSGTFSDLIQGSESAAKVAKALYEDLEQVGETDVKGKVGVEGADKVQNETDLAKHDIKSVDDTKGTGELDAEDNTSAGVGSAKSNLQGFDGQAYLAKLQAANEVQPGLGTALAALSGFAGIPFMATLASQDNATPTIAGAQSQATAFMQTYAAILAAQNNASGTISGVAQALNTLNGKTATTYVNVVKNTTEHADGKKKGEKGGLSWVGDEGDAHSPKPELVETKEGAYLAGTKGWELVELERDDIVHTASETKRLLATKFKNLVGTEHFPRFAKGKNSKKKSKAQKKKEDKYKKKVEKNRDAFDKQVDLLEYNRDYYNWSDATFNKKYKALYNKYAKKAKKIKLGKKRGSLTGDQKRDMNMSRREMDMDNAREGIESAIENIEGGSSLAAVIKKIDAERKAQKISAKEAIQYKKEAYQAQVDYNFELYENGELTYAKLKQSLDAYYKYAKKGTADYYKYQKQLAEAAKEQEIKRLEDLKDKQEKTMELAESYIDKQIRDIDKQIEQQEKLNEAKERENKLLELNNDLAKAKSQLVRVYREGQGFVYEQDIEAIQEAQKALDEFNADNATSELEKQKEAWENIADLLDDLQSDADIKDLENALGISAEKLFGGLGTDTSKWSTQIKDILSKIMGYEDAIDLLDSKEGYKAIMSMIDASTGKINPTALQNYINKNKFASGTLSAPGGLSLVGEHGAELRTLNKGDGILPANVTSNLMALGQLNPAQWENAMASNIAKKVDQGTNYSYQFDKLVLPNVQNANDFIKELQRLPNKAIQSSGRRI